MVTVEVDRQDSVDVDKHLNDMVFIKIGNVELQMSRRYYEEIFKPEIV